MGVLSRRIQKVKPSATLQITAKAKALKAEGRNVIGLGAGEPDFDTPEHIKDAAIAALKEGFTKYTAVEGILELREAIVQKFKRDNGLVYQTDQIVVTVGGKQAFYNMVMAMLDPEDEVIIPAPYWVSYPDMTILADGKPVIVNTSEATRFKLTPELLQSAITEKTRLLVLNSPSNPTGAGYSEAELAALGAVLLRHSHVWVVTDDIYEKMVYGGFVQKNIIQVVPALQDRTIILNGVSKTYSMTGWRIGYAAGPKDVIKGMTKIQGQSTSNATSIAQKAAVAAIAGDQSCIEPMLKAFAARRDFIVAALNAIPGITCQVPEGAFYVYPSVAGVIGKTTPKGKLISDTMAFADYLLEAVEVSLVPGSAFGMDPFVRISFATSMENLKEAVQRIDRAVRQLVS